MNIKVSGKGAKHVLTWERKIDKELHIRILVWNQIQILRD
uniref:Uncharacterized protein n=1 Tax=Rhizophora mucronata TaxID=61149 RepID=A0A2P2MZA3_RHIMU